MAHPSFPSICGQLRTLLSILDSRVPLLCLEAFSALQQIPL